MRSVIRRVARLERAIGRGADHPSTAIKISYVAPDGRVTSSYILEPGQPKRWIEGSTNSQAGEDGRPPG
jgi:hypothetical protein